MGVDAKGFHQYAVFGRGDSDFFIRHPEDLFCHSCVTGQNRFGVIGDDIVRGTARHGNQANRPGLLGLTVIKGGDQSLFSIDHRISAIGGDAHNGDLTAVTAVILHIVTTQLFVQAV